MKELKKPLKKPLAKKLPLKKSVIKDPAEQTSVSVKAEKKETVTLIYNSQIEKLEWLSNFQPCLIVVVIDRTTGETLKFSSVEQGFHYFKTRSPEFRQKIYNCVKAKDARYHGSEKSGCPMRPDWKEIRKNVMKNLLLAKYGQNLILKKWLLATEDAKLVELAPWDKEKFWGVDEEGNGSNNSGLLTEEVREILADKSITTVYMDRYL